MNIFEFISFLIIMGVFGLINDLFGIWLFKRYSKKANYNCENCKVWDCPNKECRKYRIEESRV